MHIHWKSLLGFGFIFWLLLCLNDFLGIEKSKHFNLDDLDEIYDKKYIQKLLETKLQSQVGTTEQRVRFGWSLLLWNSLAFIFSIMFCSCARAVSWVVWKLYTCYRNKQMLLELRTNGSMTDRSSNNISRIPVIIKSSSAITRSSDTNIKLKSKVNLDNSCPNLLAIRRSGSNLSQSTTNTNCQTLFKNNNIFPQNDINYKFDRHLENQCTKLREELLKVQANSLKEHAVLSRKLEAVTREKRELSKQLAMAQKENRAAKQQLEELLQEKAMLIKRLENATKEFKCNTKTKKFALAKLEEVTANVEDLKQQLEQVSRDKEILENKLRVLECEYEKLQERLILHQNQDNFGNYHEHTPERDLNGKDNGRALETGQELTNYQYGDVDCNTNRKNTANLLASVSQTELDMKKIQVKIKQLERNLENFNVTRSEFNFRDTDRDESELSLSLRGNNTDNQMRTDDETDVSENPFVISPRFKYWGGRAGDMVGRTEQFAKIQALATKMHEKVRFLENIRERCESVQEETEVEDDYSSRESLEDVRKPERIVSSSVAFQNFLKSLHSSESMKRQFGSQSDLYF